jgi:O-methyltransferase
MPFANDALVTLPGTTIIHCGEGISYMMMWLQTTRFLALPRTIAQKILARMNLCLLSYNEPERAKVIRLITEIKHEGRLLLAYNEAYQVFMAVKRTDKIQGEIAEVGTYSGGSARLICEAKGDRTLHLFDTFEGLPTLGKADDPKQFKAGEFVVSVEDVGNYLNKYKNVHLYKGRFPSTADPIKDKRFSFVHLDVDLYESTIAGIELFYPRMNRGGIIISHDYISVPGVRKAFDDFFKDKPEPIIEMSGSQCLIVKL